jgi:hypothetical protein
VIVHQQPTCLPPLKNNTLQSNIHSFTSLSLSVSLTHFLRPISFSTFHLQSLNITPNKQKNHFIFPLSKSHFLIKTIPSSKKISSLQPPLIGKTKQNNRWLPVSGPVSETRAVEAAKKGATTT